jgi:hypothetical protein
MLGISGLARRSLLLSSIMLFSQGCIVADPPEYRAPGQTRPELNVYSAVPTAIQALTVYSNPPVATNISVPFRSEDAGEQLRALFFLDYQVPKAGETQPGQDRLVGQTIPPSTYDNTDRAISHLWLPDTTPGCHFLTLIVAHRSSFLDSNEDRLDPRKADEDAAMVTWTVNVDPADGRTLINCPSTGTTGP